MQSVSSRIWTRVAVSISCDDNHYTTGTSMYMYIETILFFITEFAVEFGNKQLLTISVLIV